jgi:hypothetical protein
MGVGPGTIELSPSPTQERRIEVGPDGKKRLVGPVISLTDPLPVAAKLAGGPDAAAPGADSAQFRVIVKGEALPAVAGRVDDFAWPGAKAPATGAGWVAKPN